MAGRLISMLVVVLAAAWWPASAHAASCKSRAPTLAQNKSVRVFEDAEVLYACWRPGKTVRVIGESIVSSTGSASLVEFHDLRGGVVLLSTARFDQGVRSSLTKVSLVNVRSGRVRSRGIAVDSIASPTLSAQGSGVWTQRRGNAVAVVALTARSFRVLDDLPGIEDGSVAVKRDRAYWTRNGIRQSAAGV